MKKSLFLLAAALMLSSCSLLSPNQQAGESKPASNNTSVVSQEPNQELAVDEEDAAEAAMLQATVGMGMIAESAPMGRVRRNASPIDGIKQSIADLIASSVANFRLTCGVNSASYTIVDSDLPEYSSLFQTPIDLGSMGQATGKLYFNLGTDLTYTGGLKVTMTGFATLQSSAIRVPNYPVEAAFITRFSGNQIENSFFVKASYDDRNYVECDSPFSPNGFADSRDIHVKVTLNSQIAFDETVNITIPESGDVIVTINYQNEQFAAKISVMAPEEDVYRIDANITYYGFSTKLGADATLIRNAAGDPVQVKVHFDDDPAETIYTSNC
ncbi:MAG: hypothetical protein J5736_02580 [Bacilli bacterium]|nr:hypothetical protein [Bacilli bacterium]